MRHKLNGSGGVVLSHNVGKSVQVGAEIINLSAKYEYKLQIIIYNKHAKGMLHYNGLRIIKMHRLTIIGLGNMKIWSYMVVVYISGLGIIRI